MEKPNGKLIFYGDEVPITFPPSYDKFLLILREILGLEENFISNVRLSYRDRDEDKIEVKSEDDYRIFMEDIQKGRQMNMTIEVKEESNLDIKKCSSSILNYVEKKSGNINNLSEQIKKNSVELNEEDDIKNEKNLNLDENVINLDNNEEDSNQLIMNNNISNEINNNNNNANKNNDIIKPNEENNLDLDQINNINNINNKIKKENPIPQNNNQINNINNINNIPQNKNIPQNQNIPQQNIPQMSQNRNMNIMPQNQGIPQMSQNQISQNKLSNKFLYMIQFPYACSFCRIGPIYRVMYFCRECNLIICPRCEQKEGEKHHHPLFKVQNTSQFNYLNINGPTAMDKFMDRMEGAANSAYNSVMNFFGAGGNNNANNNINNNSRIPQRQAPQLVSIVQLARNMYDLRNVNDQQIEEALIKAQGNIDQAVFSLVPK